MNLSRRRGARPAEQINVLVTWRFQDIPNFGQDGQWTSMNIRRFWSKIHHFLVNGQSHLIYFGENSPYVHFINILVNEHKKLKLSYMFYENHDLSPSLLPSITTMSWLRFPDAWTHSALGGGSNDQTTLRVRALGGWEDEWNHRNMSDV